MALASSSCGSENSIKAKKERRSCKATPRSSFVKNGEEETAKGEGNDELRSKGPPENIAFGSLDRNSEVGSKLFQIPAGRDFIAQRLVETIGVGAMSKRPGLAVNGLATLERLTRKADVAGVSHG
jgi:hypothetical protein